MPFSPLALSSEIQPLWVGTGSVAAQVGANHAGSTIKAQIAAATASIAHLPISSSPKQLPASAALTAT